MSDGAPAKSGFFRTIARLFLLRLFAFAFVLLLVYGGLQTLGFVIPERYPEFRTDAFQYALSATSVLLSLGANILLVRLFEGRSTKELSLIAGVPFTILGALLGFALFVTVYLIFGALGYAKWGGTYMLTGLAPALVLSIVSGVGEEIIFRGGIFRILEDSFGTLIALLLSAAMFGAMHAGNPNASALSSVSIALEAGILLGLAYSVARNLWLPIGLHFGWNFTEGGISAPPSRAMRCTAA
ncbi:MAG: type II CAAX endopeptidase family protein [Alphaproteobacteria bacterium]